MSRRQRTIDTPAAWDKQLAAALAAALAKEEARPKDGKFAELIDDLERIEQDANRQASDPYGLVARLADAMVTALRKVAE